MCLGLANIYLTISCRRNPGPALVILPRATAVWANGAFGVPQSYIKAGVGSLSHRFQTDEYGPKCDGAGFYCSHYFERPAAAYLFAGRSRFLSTFLSETVTKPLRLHNFNLFLIRQPGLENDGGGWVTHETFP